MTVCFFSKRYGSFERDRAAVVTLSSDKNCPTIHRSAGEHMLKLMSEIPLQEYKESVLIMLMNSALKYHSRIVTCQSALFYGELKSDKKQEMIQLLSKLTTESFKEELVDIHLEAEGFVLGLRNFPFEVFGGRTPIFLKRRKN